MAKELTNEELEKQLELEERREALEARKIQNELQAAQLEDLRQQKAMKKANKERGQADAKQAIEALKAVQARCNHHTGGQGAMAILNGQGDLKRPTCIGGQQFLDDRIRLFCTRCRAECFSDDKDQAKWAYWVGLWRESTNTVMMIVGGVKTTRVNQLSA